MSIYYHKIEGLYKREETGKHLLIEGSYRNPMIEYLRNNEFIFEEKVDGTNIFVLWDGHDVTFHGRTEKAQIPNDVTAFLGAKFGGEQIENLFEQMFGEKEVIIYGESYGPKIQKVGALYRDDVSFIVFDVKINGMFVDRRSAEEIAHTFGCDFVPFVMSGTIQQAVDFIKTYPASIINSKAPMEGVVGRPLVEVYDKQGNRAIVKIKVNEMKELEKTKKIAK